MIKVCLADPRELGDTRVYMVYVSPADVRGPGGTREFMIKVCLADVREPGDTSCRNCQHQYTFRGAARGIFTSPGFPDNYPDKTTCCYFFNARDDGRVRIEFDYFDLEKSENA